MPPPGLVPTSERAVMPRTGRLNGTGSSVKGCTALPARKKDSRSKLMSVVSTLALIGFLWYELRSTLATGIPH
jgi:hypothetical protein